MSLPSVAQLAQDLSARRISARELAEESLARAEKNQALNAFVTRCENVAMAAASAADVRLAAGNAGVLTGIPFAHKDIFCTNGIRTSCGSRMLDNFVPPYDATVSRQLNDAGAVLIGKTNMDEFAMGSSNESSFYGPVQNPWDTTRVPGGSSGGSAAAVAAGIVPFATGTDTGGSIRQPAAFCGITGLKPTYGRVSRLGMIAFASSLDCGGVLARSAEDCAHVLSAIAGHDAGDPTSARHAVDDYPGALNRPLAGLRIGLPRAYFGAGIAADVGRVVHAALAELEKLGAVLVEVDLVHADLAIPAYYVIAPAEASSNLARYDGVRYGYRCTNPSSLEDLYMRTRAEGFGAEVKRRILVGTYVLSAGYYDAYYLRAQRVRRLIANDFNTAFAQVDVLAGPTTPTVAFKLGEKSSDPLAMYAADVNTVAMNLAGLPAISVPAGFSDGLPVGLQLIAPAFAEARLLNIAHRLQQATDWHTRTPEIAHG
ncbi:Asp-tRNA(Asn)/Glu-tRNA(Gln) amidotransferase subunit GatA [Pseudolysobacter antarcticus]|uniref:Glutamyl-tRNA(Gln) amidotransferase subunit A n=1 Tax=Pseudolysobacter antarcticus TaxID=2511995 RepID=A0A411HFQ6_9GAMM|nr:Asp-tRNA(Asn)/Glu-tRNA(Gln) amidotransferase subunit GatA [Pseudolysobacter antarcticus]QBB69284.1 Asp-tRNA(Asn)/Glu-tRNA(Gln) amidotransferase subunit GatA [Pseudolysobacter antarcticus]